MVTSYRQSRTKNHVLSKFLQCFHPIAQSCNGLLSSYKFIEFPIVCDILFLGLCRHDQVSRLGAPHCVLVHLEEAGTTCQFPHQFIDRSLKLID